jgi:hypothetical protein
MPLVGAMIGGASVPKPSEYEATAKLLGAQPSLNALAMNVVFAETGTGPAYRVEVSEGSCPFVVYRIVEPGVAVVISTF